VNGSDPAGLLFVGPNGETCGPTPAGCSDQAQQRSAEGDPGWGGSNDVGIDIHPPPVVLEGGFGVNITFQADLQISGSKKPTVTFSPSDQSFDIGSDGVDASLSKNGITGLGADIPGVAGQRITNTGYQFYNDAEARIGQYYITTTFTETLTPSRVPIPDDAVRVDAAASIGLVGLIIILAPKVGCLATGPFIGGCEVVTP
jgi:hypothetical protein